MTPKSLLRHPSTVSSLEDLARGTFERILPDGRKKPKTTSRVLLCSGKIFYELEQARRDLGRDDVAILRVEQLYPLREKTLEAALAPYADGTPAYWVQEEPENMGAWRYMRIGFGEKLAGRLPFSRISRPASASPATGSASSHRIEQQQIIETAFSVAS